MVGIILFIFFSLLAILVCTDFMKYLVSGRRLFGYVTTRIIEALMVIGLPLLFILSEDRGLENNCCAVNIFFSPAHRLTIYTWIAACIVAFLTCSGRRLIFPPVIEVLLNVLLLIGIILNILIACHEQEFLWLWGNLPIGLLFIIALMENQKKLILHTREKGLSGDTFLTRTAWKVLSLSLIFQFPILLLLCLPVIMVVTSILLLFGQKPDAAVRAFTETYKHGFSQLDHLCRNVECGGHFLCSVAAKGHKNVVKPERLGVRGGGLIICNRQLLVANAFEELLEEHLPKTHKVIRRNYNRVGALIHKHYAVFDHKYLCDVVYLAMKPAEWLFLLVLYTFDRAPERRIARQYLGKEERKAIAEFRF